MQKYRTGTSVEWKWGKGTGTGQIKQSFTDDVERTIEGAVIKRKASKEEPAYLIEQQDGGKVLKNHSELTKSR
jgi:hypothetical protein